MQIQPNYQLVYQTLNSLAASTLPRKSKAEAICRLAQTMGNNSTEKLQKIIDEHTICRTYEDKKVHQWAMQFLNGLLAIQLKLESKINNRYSALNEVDC